MAAINISEQQQNPPPPTTTNNKQQALVARPTTGAGGSYMKQKAAAILLLLAVLFVTVVVMVDFDQLMLPKNDYEEEVGATTRTRNSTYSSSRLRTTKTSDVADAFRIEEGRLEMMTMTDTDADVDNNNINNTTVVPPPPSVPVVPAAQEEEEEEPPQNASTTSTTSLLLSSSPVRISPNQTKPFTIVCQLSGEMGNQLGHLAHCYSIQLWLQREYGVSTNIMLRHQRANKWIRARNSVVQCFPTFRNWQFESEAYTSYFDERKKVQNEVLGANSSNILTGINQKHIPAEVVKALAEFKNITTTAVQSMSALNDNHTITVPFLHANSMLALDIYMDKFYEDLLEYMHFDYDKCCKQRPDPDESVFHYRNFATEMPKNLNRKGFNELSPSQTANALFGHLNPGDKVAIVTRFSAKEAKPITDALEHRGLKVRVIKGQSGTQDFCFLMSAQKEMIGIVISTYFFWAGILSQNCKRVLAYSVDTEVRRKKNNGNALYSYNWTHPDLKKKMEYQLFAPY